MTGLVTPRIVRSPVSFQSSSLGSTPVDLKLTNGYCSASRKSAERKWLSRSAVPVVIDAALASIYDGGVERVVGHDDCRCEILECASDLGHHEVTGGDAQLGVHRVDLPGPGYRHQSAFDISSGGMGSISFVEGLLERSTIVRSRIFPTGRGGCSKHSFARPL